MKPIKCNWCGYDITHYFNERPIPNINDNLKEFLCGACLNQYEKGLDNGNRLL